ncbi:MAG: thioredoxin domain-containing protein [Microbacteriaceae bacterium]
MTNRLADAISPYLRSHADNPVDWYPWGEDAFAEAARRHVPVLVSIGYATCHWCHVMARESFSDPELATALNENFVAIKVDREEHPDVDASYLAAASAFTDSLGWPLNVFVTPEGRAFYAGTYFPPRAGGGRPSFRQVLDAVNDAWTNRPGKVQAAASAVIQALSASRVAQPSSLPDAEALTAVVQRLEEVEDTEYGGFGGAPKFPVAPVLGFLLGSGPSAQDLGVRTLHRMAHSPLRDRVEGGFFRYATRRDWSEPHYERMLYDNAQLLTNYADAWRLDPEENGWAQVVTADLAEFLIQVMRLPSGCFASGQDSESTVAGKRVEGGYYALDAAARSGESPPALDEKVLTGWNGLAIRGLAHAGFVFDRPSWVDAARAAADALIGRHLRANGSLARASIGDRVSTATATLEDYGMFAGGLLELALVTGESHYAVLARTLMDAALAAGSDGGFAVPGGGDPLLTEMGLALQHDPSEGAYPSGISACADAAYTLYLLTAEDRYRDAAQAAMSIVAGAALSNPASFGAALAVMSALTAGATQLVVVAPESGAERSDLPAAARAWQGPALVCVVTEPQASAFAEAGFELFEGRGSQNGLATAYLCRDFVCRLPVVDAAQLAAQ